jgi:hypothetical protein
LVEDFRQELVKLDHLPVVPEVLVDPGLHVELGVHVLHVLCLHL